MQRRGRAIKPANRSSGCSSRLAILGCLSKMKIQRPVWLSFSKTKTRPSRINFQRREDTLFSLLAKHRQHLLQIEKRGRSRWILSLPGTGKQLAAVLSSLLGFEQNAWRAPSCPSPATNDRKTNMSSIRFTCSMSSRTFEAPFPQHTMFAEYQRAHTQVTQR